MSTQHNTTHNFRLEKLLFQKFMNAWLIEFVRCRFSEQYGMALIQVRLRSKNGCVSTWPFWFVVELLVCFEILHEWFRIDFDGSNIVADADTFRCGLRIRRCAAIYDHAVQAQCVEIHNFHQTDDWSTQAKSENASKCGCVAMKGKMYFQFEILTIRLKSNLTKQTIPCHVHIAAVFDARNVFEVDL